MTQVTTSQTHDMIMPVAGARSHGRALIMDLITLTKPRITVMVVVTSYLGFVLGFEDAGASAAGAEGGASYVIALTLTLLGTAFSCMAAAAMNQAYEHDTDALMRRTQNRPLPSGRVGLPVALTLGLLLAVAGTTLLALVHPLAGALGAFTIVSYVLIYTPLKRVTQLSTIVGAVPGAMPPMLGYAAAAGTLGAPAWVIFSIMFIWQLPHFLAIAWLYREDYARAGMPVLPVVDPDGASTFRQALVGCLALLPLGLLPTMLNISGLMFFWGSLTAGVAFLGFAVALVIGRTRAHARAMFFASLLYLPIVLALMVLDRV